MRLAGAAIINCDPFTCGREGTGRGVKSNAFYTVHRSSLTGYLVVWSWGVSGIIDVLAASGGTVLKAAAVGASGCSWYGKSAFVAGALDDHVALTSPVESGTGGAGCCRCIAKESGLQPLSNAHSEQRRFCDDFPYTNPTSIPVDTHEVIGLMAPRGLFIMDKYVPSAATCGKNCVIE
jgi:hypothetical protein